MMLRTESATATRKSDTATSSLVPVTCPIMREMTTPPKATTRPDAKTPAAAAGTGAVGDTVAVTTAPADVGATTGDAGTGDCNAVEDAAGDAGGLAPPPPGRAGGLLPACRGASPLELVRRPDGLGDVALGAGGRRRP